MKAARDIAQRIVNAENAFITSVMEQFGFTLIESAKILVEYKKAKVLSIDPVCGQFKLKHGAFWDKDVMLNAVNS